MIVVVGAGVVGLAVARLVAKNGLDTVVLEAGPRIAEGVTSRNSGVIHSPLNYASGTLKGLLCARGRELLYEWCESSQVPHLQAGKLVVATNPSEADELERIQGNALSFGATEIRILSRQELLSLEPATDGAAALFSPRTGIIDPYELSRSFLLDAESHGCSLVLNAKLTAVEKIPSGYRLETTLGSVEAEAVVNCAGLQADAVSALAGITSYRIYPWRGDYFSFKPGSDRRFQRLIYPVKMKSDPGLGVHLTLGLAGNYRLGPDVELVSSKGDFSPREDKLDLFLKAARKLFPWATREMLAYDTCGIRPKLRGPSDREEKDFVISEDLPGWINLLGIESPGLTASMAIAEKVLALLT